MNQQGQTHVQPIGGPLSKEPLTLMCCTNNSIVYENVHNNISIHREEFFLQLHNKVSMTDPNFLKPIWTLAFMSYCIGAAPQNWICNVCAIKHKIPCDYFVLEGEVQFDNKRETIRCSALYWADRISHCCSGPWSALIASDTMTPTGSEYLCKWDL